MSAQGFHVRREGAGPVVVLSHALGCDLHMFDAVADDLAQDFSVLRYDHRGHGATTAPPGGFTIEQLAGDAAAVLRTHCNDEPALFVGVSLGGMVAQALAHIYPLRGLVVANSALAYDDAAKALWRQRIDAVHAGGMEPLLNAALDRWFSPVFKLRNPDAVSAARRTLAHCEPTAYAVACAAVMHIDFSQSNAGINCPVLVIDGRQDSATPPAMSDAIAASLKHAARASLNTGHLSATEDPHGFARCVRDFSNTLTPPSS